MLANRIGTDASGREALGNAVDGILVTNSAGNAIGGLSPVALNLISGNLGDGVVITGAGSTGNGLINNEIGTDLSGEHATYDLGLDGTFGTADDRLVGNGVDGVRVENAGPGNAIAGNVISANLAVGLEIAGTSAATVVVGNVIGLDALGTLALGNGFGVYLNNSVGNTIGGTAPGAGNVISGNSGVGLAITRIGSGSTGDTIQGNLIGTNALGQSVPLGPLQSVGIYLDAAPENLIGGTTPGARNVISGNTTAGISIFGQATDGTDLDNQIVGNQIGTTVSGLPLLGPARLILQDVGVVINNSAGNVIGGVIPGAGDTIEGNRVGVEIAGIVEKLGNATTGNVVADDTIETNGFGVFLNAAQDNSIIGDDLSSNVLIGLSIVGPTATGNVAELDTIDNNFEIGVYIEAAAGNPPGQSPNSILHDTINHNTMIGVYLSRGATGNLVASDKIQGSSQQYGVFLYNSAGNIGAITRTGANAIDATGNSIAQFREFTGPETSPTSAPLTNLPLAPSLAASSVVPSKSKTTIEA